MTTALSRPSPPIKIHGGKSYLAERISDLMPPRCRTPNAPAPDDSGWLHYVEPYFGGGAVLLANDPEGVSEVVNDINGHLMNFWRVLQAPDAFAVFKRRVEATPFAKPEWERDGRVQRIDAVDVEAAAAFFVRNRQSLAGRMDRFAPLTRNRTRRGMNEQASAWWTAIDGLPAVHERLKRVAIYNEDALLVIRREDGPRTLFYLDPPYVHETRATTTEYGEHEMTPEQHSELLKLLCTIKGRFLLSGYHSRLYDETAAANGWNSHEFELPNNAAGGKTKRRMTEVIWCNF
jgi:DNA adenine methylase